MASATRIGFRIKSDSIRALLCVGSICSCANRWVASSPSFPPGFLRLADMNSSAYLPATMGPASVPQNCTFCFGLTLAVSFGTFPYFPR